MFEGAVGSGSPSPLTGEELTLFPRKSSAQRVRKLSFLDLRKYFTLIRKLARPAECPPLSSVAVGPAVGGHHAVSLRGDS
ncbi:hypothetical protein CDAR_546391 [Caerostris darwini]|uniref:Uncharacterized protein n=1 Tax=Caerostris darwini TaxID=1538125 RepID=A0AAV4RMP4_9ARAC|nr:hypothetical protein CDAR_546391 [Caerostris darwini]